MQALHYKIVNYLVAVNTHDKPFVLINDRDSVNVNASHCQSGNAVLPDFLARELALVCGQRLLKIIGQSLHLTPAGPGLNRSASLVSVMELRPSERFASIGTFTPFVSRSHYANP